MKIEILVKKIRLENNMTLETLSQLSGISKWHLSKIERQERDPKLSTMVQIALALKVDIDKLYKVIPWHWKCVIYCFYKIKKLFRKKNDIFVKQKGCFVKSCPNAT